MTSQANPYFLKPIPEKTCPRCLFDDTIAVIGDTQCEYCDLHDQLAADAKYDWDKQLAKIRNPKSKYDCLIGISGGSDSSTILYMAVKVWKLRVLTVHLDNHWNSPAADHNMSQLVKKLNVDHIRFSVNKAEYDMINEAFLESGTPDLDICNDNLMSYMLLKLALDNNIKTLIHGHCIYTEGSTPKLWTRIDGKYIANVYEDYTGKKLVSYPILTLWDQIRYTMKGIKQMRPYHHREIFRVRPAYEQEMKEFIGWQEYPGKHAENAYTAWIGSHVLPQKFGIDKRLVYLSAKVRTGFMTREAALEQLAIPPSFDLSQIPQSIQDHLTSKITPREVYGGYNYKKWKWPLWVLMKMGVFPRTAWVKYCN